VTGARGKPFNERWDGGADAVKVGNGRVIMAT
jgi:hypothetical protein